MNRKLLSTAVEISRKPIVAKAVENVPKHHSVKTALLALAALEAEILYAGDGKPSPTWNTTCASIPDVTPVTFSSTKT